MYLHSFFYYYKKKMLVERNNKMLNITYFVTEVTLCKKKGNKINQGYS